MAGEQNGPGFPTVNETWTRQDIAKALLNQLQGCHRIEDAAVRAETLVNSCGLEEFDAELAFAIQGNVEVIKLFGARSHAEFVFCLSLTTAGLVPWDTKLMGLVAKFAEDRLFTNLRNHGLGRWVDAHISGDYSKLVDGYTAHSTGHNDRA